MKFQKRAHKQFDLLALLLIIFLTMFSYPFKGYCQDSTQRKGNIVYLELGGNCMVYSLNYERMFTNELSFRAGVAYVPFEDYDYWIPLLVNFIMNVDNNNSFELGLGGRLEISKFSNYMAPTGSLGYRYNPRDGRIFFKIAYSPFYNDLKEKFVSWVGVGIGMQL
ncbi:MAG: hypothetical protein ACM3S2_17835 [Ignavibacteriales bacterium]